MHISLSSRWVHSSCKELRVQSYLNDKEALFINTDNNNVLRYVSIDLYSLEMSSFCKNVKTNFKKNNFMLLKYKSMN